mmetsp:Transcript_14163/g.18463  ORF Transcript_14163/g.18463 Transcript_14163/m.18463 type:complete len:90 (+) Transcript_14163:227-496(+)
MKEMEGAAVAFVDALTAAADLVRLTASQQPRQKPYWSGDDDSNSNTLHRVLAITFFFMLTTILISLCKLVVCYSSKQYDANYSKQLSGR